MPLILEERFIPINLIGQGGFGRTFLARDLRSPNQLQQVVIKQLCPQIPSGQSHLTPLVLERIRNLFHQEGMVLRALHHSQIPQVYTSFVVETLASPNPSSTISNGQQQFYYLVQEYIEGRNLLQELQQNGKFSGREIVEFLQQMLSVIGYIHIQVK
ncbi:MAG: hypothetical protein PUP91_33715 [Rhizonema sp. PD37]|nr:hypothetical protein [Rhizonema sp. PD37]